MFYRKTLLLLLFLLSVFGSSSAHAFLGKNRVGDFFSQGRKPAGLNGPANPTSAGKNPYCHYETASGNPEARYYNPLIRRFVNSDPARDAWNWFAYAGGNPVSYVDPTGFAANLANGGGGNLESLGFNAGGLEHMAAEAEVFALKSLVTMANVIGAPWGAELPYPGEAIANIRRGYGVDPNSSSAQIIDETTDIAMIAGSAIVTRKGGGGKYGTTPKSRPLTKHYSTETGPKRNIPGSVVDNTIDTTRGVPVGGGKTVHYDSKNNVTVVTGDGGSIVSARKGPPRKGQE